MAKKYRLDKMLANLGYGSRKDIKKICTRGRVTVDGKAVKDSGLNLDPEKHEIMIDEEVIQYREYVYIMLNKPAGVISATWDNMHTTVVDLLDPMYAPFEVFPVGRLDKDTEGLLLLTNDGKLAHELLSPKKKVGKIYYAKINKEVTDDDIKSFKEGVTLDDGYKTLPAELRVLKNDGDSEIEVQIYEGKYHQVKRMFESVGKEVTYLKRLSMGALELDNRLELGEYRELTEEELKNIS